METKDPSQAHRRLEVFEGTWMGEETLHPSPWDPVGGAATGRLESRMGLDGFFLITDYVEERGGRVRYRGHGVYGWDPREQLYTMHWYDSMGSKVSAKGSWEGEVLTYSQRSETGHARYVYTPQDSGRYHFRIEVSQDGHAWASVMEATYRKT